MEQKTFIIDFDSTFIQTEGLEELAEISLKNNPQKVAILKKIRDLSDLAMAGKMNFGESLEKRLKLLDANITHLALLNKVLSKKISLSILRNKSFFKKNAKQIYLISGGFKEFILPLAQKFGIDNSHVIANEFKLDKAGNIVGHIAASKSTKAESVKALKLKGEVIVIGDGFTDLEIINLGAAQQFIAFTENINREVVSKKADKIVKSFDEVLFLHSIPATLSYPKSKIKALLLENIEQSAVQILEKEGYQVELLTKALDEEELSEKIKDISVLGIRSKTKVTKKVLENANKLKVVGAFCIGTDQMDLEALEQKGVAVFNAPFQNTRSVVELAIGEMIMLLRGVVDKSNKLHQGVWDKSAKGSNEIRGKTLGIIGYGNIGSQLSVLAENLGMNVIFYDSVEKLPMGNAKKAASLNDLLKISDIVTVHVSGLKSNSNLIGEKEFAQMKNGAIFLNLSRGFIVDLSALEQNLKSGKLRGAALDVYPHEPKSKDEKLELGLQGLSNVILTPHIAGSTEEAQKNIAEFVSNKLIDFINTGNTYLSVNFPNIQLPAQGNSHRLLHLHKNVPGILAQINQVLADNNINILGQYLKTNENVGYLITDVNKKYDSKSLKELKNIENTISFRVLY